MRCNFGMPGPEGYRKAQRLMRQAEKFGRPIITFVDTPGAYPGKEAEERGQGEAIARCLALMSSLTVPVIAVVTGEGGSGGALALAVANRVLMLEHAVYSVLSPEGFASILWKDSSRSGEACAVMKLTAQDLRRGGIVQGVLREPEGGAHTDWEATFRTVDAALRKELAALDKLNGRALAQQRYQMFRAMGQNLCPGGEKGGVMSAPQILATGRCLPSRTVTNEDICRMVETTDEWIFTRTGIRSRYYCQGERGADLAEGAARQALERSGLSPEDIGVCLVSTFTPDFATPSTACQLQKRLGLREDTICFDLNAACAGFLYGMRTAHALLADSPRPYALLVGCEVISRVADQNDRSTFILFGDGAGAAVIRRREDAEWHTVAGPGETGTPSTVRDLVRPPPSSIWTAGRCSASPWRCWSPPSTSCWRRRAVPSTTWTGWSAIRPTAGFWTMCPNTWVPGRACFTKIWSGTATPPRPAFPWPWTSWSRTGS